jgi:recombinational DNA repair ATPase RecF
VTIEHLELPEPRALNEAILDFTPGINVFLGANASGKSHAMKALYAPLKTLEQNGGTTVPLAVRLHEKIANPRPTSTRGS